MNNARRKNATMFTTGKSKAATTSDAAGASRQASKLSTTSYVLNTGHHKPQGRTTLPEAEEEEEAAMEAVAEEEAEVKEPQEAQHHPLQHHQLHRRPQHQLLRQWPHQD